MKQTPQIKQITNDLTYDGDQFTETDYLIGKQLQQLGNIEQNYQSEYEWVIQKKITKKLFFDQGWTLNNFYLGKQRQFIYELQKLKGSKCKQSVFKYIRTNSDGIVISQYNSPKAATCRMSIYQFVCLQYERNWNKKDDFSPSKQYHITSWNIKQLNERPITYSFKKLIPLNSYNYLRIFKQKRTFCVLQISQNYQQVSLSFYRYPIQYNNQPIRFYHFHKQENFQYKISDQGPSHSCVIIAKYNKLMSKNVQYFICDEQNNRKYTIDCLEYVDTKYKYSYPITFHLISQGIIFLRFNQIIEQYEQQETVRYTETALQNQEKQIFFQKTEMVWNYKKNQYIILNKTFKNRRLQFLNKIYTNLPFEQSKSSILLVNPENYELIGKMIYPNRLSWLNHEQQFIQDQSLFMNYSESNQKYFTQLTINLNKINPLKYPIKVIYVYFIENIMKDCDLDLLYQLDKILPNAIDYIEY